MNNAAATSTKLPPERVREHLSRDVHAILSGCIHEFKESHRYEEKCFDVDAVISGRSLFVRTRYEEKVTPASWAMARPQVGTDRPLTRALKGNFIPAAAFARG